MVQKLKGSSGLPIVGETLELFSDPYTFSARRRAKYGEIFVTSALGKRTIVALTAAGQEHILVTRQDNYLAGSGYGFLAPLLEGMLLLSDGDFHRQERKWVTPSFHAGAITGYLDTINRIVGQQLDTWGGQGTIGIYTEMSRISFKIGAALFLGLQVNDETHRLLSLWQPFADGLKAVVRVRGPLTSWGRALIARRRIDALGASIIAKQRATRQANMLQLLLDIRDDSGNPMSDSVLVNWIRFFLFASYETTAATVTWLITELLLHPDLLERVRAEVHSEEQGAPVTLDEFKNKPLLDAIINETLRLYPQVMQFIRGIAADDTFAGVAMPQGWNAMIIPAYTHRRPDYFADPDKFDPDRFLAPREEHKATPYAFIGFGGGGHACLGEGVARVEIKTVLTSMLRRFPSLRLLPNQDLSQVYIPLSRPKSNVYVEYRAG